MREVIETTNDIRSVAEELSSILVSDFSMVKKAKTFEATIKEVTHDVRATLELFNIKDLTRFGRIWPKLEVEAEREHAKECDVCFGDERDQKEQFEAEVKECLAEIKKLKDLDFPASSDRFVANYTKSSEAFSLIVEVNLMGFKVTCVNATLRKIVEDNLSKVPTNQTSRNFLFCAAKALPEEFDGYKLVL